MDRDRTGIYNKMDHRKEKVVYGETETGGCMYGRTDFYKCSGISYPVRIGGYRRYTVYDGAWGGL